jgi:hypothetical protein
MMSALLRVASASSAADRPILTWKLLWAFAVYWGWQIATKLILGLIYLAVISEGLRVLIPALGQKLYKLPGLSPLQDFEGTYRLDLAPFFALFLLVAVFVLWGRIIEVVVSDRDPSLWTTEERFLFVLGCVILGADAILFFFAMTQMGWGSGFTLSALVATAAYVGVLVFVSWMSVHLHPGRKG